jgi:alpha-D-xyloside xylohydrolase
MRRFPVLVCLLALAGCQPKAVRIDTPQGTLCLEPVAEDAIRVRMTPEGAPELGELIFTEKAKTPKYTVERSGDDVIVRTAKMSAVWNAEAQALSFLDADDNLLLRECGHSVVPAEVQGEPAWAASARFDSPAGEHLYGTGQFQDGYLDIRGLTRRLTQVNTQIALPMILSNRGWGLLWHNYGLTDFNPADHSLALKEAAQDGGSVTVNATGTAGNRREMRFFRTFTGEIDLPEDGEYALLLDVGRDMARRQYLAVDGEPVIDISNTWLPPTAAVKTRLSAGRHRLVVQGTFGDAPVVFWRAVTDETVFSSPVASGLDYVVFAGGADAVMHSFRSLAGHVPALPDWIFRYIHCRERFDTQDELLTVARRLHEEQIPVGTIVQDWQWWGKYGWNAMRFDEDKYPAPKAMTDELHAMDQHLMLSVWSRIGRDSELGKEVEANGYYIEGTEWVDFFQPDAAAFYWKNFSEKLLPTGIDAWWQDATEPENDDLKGRRIGPDQIPGEWYRNVYPLHVIRTVYEGLRHDQPDRLPVILTRSAFPGIQRYGAVTWSGDVGNDWDALRRQLAGGLGQMAAGLPWWTYDAGGFFRPGNQYKDPDYQERMIRWIQAAEWLPFMRVHGYQSRTEPWEYSPETERLFKAAVARREAMLPYITEQAARVWEEDYTLMRPLVFDFPQDEEALKQNCEWMFGPDYLVCPVTEGGVASWTVYLPAHEAGWEDIRTGARLAGGQYAVVPVDLEAIPVFRKL